MTTTAQNAPSATVKQIAYIKALRQRINGAPEPHGNDQALTEALHGMTRQQASAYIDNLRAQERDRLRDESSRFDADTVPAGRYALTNDGETAFYQVDRPTQGRWDGWTFLNLIHAGGSRIRPIKGAQRGRVLALVAQDPTAASRAYGQHTGTCGVCSRTLSNPESVAAGIGPVCASRIA